MKAFTLIALALAFAAVQASSVQASLNKIDNHPHGRALLNLISMNLQIKTPFADIEEILGDVHDSLETDYAFQTDTYNNNVARLQGSIAQGEAFQASLEAAIQGLEATIDNLNNNIATTTDILNNDQNELASKQGTLDQINAAYPTDIANFDAELENIDEAVDAINQAIQLVGELVQRENQEQGTSLVQLSSKCRASLNALAQKLQKSTSRKNSMTPLIRELVQLAATAQVKDAARILELVQNLKAILTTADVDLQAEKATYIQNYNDEVASLTGRIDDLNNAIAIAQENIATWTQSVADNEANLAQQQDSLADVVAQLQADEDELAAVEQRWAEYVPEQEELIALVEQLIDHFNNNVQAIDDFVKQRIDVDATA